MLSASLTLRVLIVVEWLLVVILIVSVFVFELPLPTELEQYVDREAEKPLSRSDWLWSISAMIVLLVSLLASIGLWFFRSWARPTYATAVLGNIALSALDEPLVAHPFVVVFSDLSLIVVGAIVALAYFGRIDAFERTTA